LGLEATTRVARLLGLTLRQAQRLLRPEGLLVHAGSSSPIATVRSGS
jgi:hypothetical protein